jgi:hypothetical protein
MALIFTEKGLAGPNVPPVISGAAVVLSEFQSEGVALTPPVPLEAKLYCNTLQGITLFPVPDPT